MQKIVIAVVVAVILLGGGYYVLTNQGVTWNDMNISWDDAEGTFNNPKAGQEQADTSVGESKVVIKNFSFSPNVIRVKAGTKVTWAHEDIAGHTVTSDTGAFGSKILSQGQSFEQVFAQKGTFSYHCTPHPSMKGTVIVE